MHTGLIFIIFHLYIIIDNYMYYIIIILYNMKLSYYGMYDIFIYYLMYIVCSCRYCTIILSQRV